MDILKELAAETLLSGSHILTAIESLKRGLRYKSNGQEIAYDDFWKQLTERIHTLPKIELQTRVAPGCEDEYLIKLANALEAVYDRVDQELDEVLYFEGKLATAVNQTKDLRLQFVAWYTIAVEAKLKESTIKVASKLFTSLADSEFSRLLDHVDEDLVTLLEIVKVQEQKLKNAKKLALNKYNLGKDQANAAWTSGVGPHANGFGSKPGDLLTEPADEEEDSDEVPEFVSKKPVIIDKPTPNAVNSVPVPPFSDPVVGTDVIKGTFKKTLTPVALAPVKNEEGEPTVITGRVGPVPPADPKLTELLEAARHHVITPEEHREQRISFAAGNLALHTGEDIEIVKARVRAADAELNGDLPSDPAVRAQAEARQPAPKAVIVISTNKNAPPKPVILPKPAAPVQKVATKITINAPKPAVAPVAVGNEGGLPPLITPKPIIIPAAVPPAVKVEPAPTLQISAEPVEVAAPSKPATPRKPLLMTEDEAVM
jgi:hypothetical protein